MNPKKSSPMDMIQTEALFMMLAVERKDKAKFDSEVFAEFMANEELSIVSHIIQQRIEVLSLPKLEPSALIALSILSGGNPGKGILGLVETLENVERVKKAGKTDFLIDGEFICYAVFPFGFYSDAEWYGNFEYRKEHKEEGYNRII